jgi:hypothetical protein
VVVVVDGSGLPVRPGFSGFGAAHAVNVTNAIAATTANESHRVTRRMPPPVRNSGSARF